MSTANTLDEELGCGVASGEEAAAADPSNSSNAGTTEEMQETAPSTQSSGLVEDAAYLADESLPIATKVEPPPPPPELLQRSKFLITGAHFSMIAKK